LHGIGQLSPQGSEQRDPTCVAAAHPRAGIASAAINAIHQDFLSASFGGAIRPLSGRAQRADFTSSRRGYPEA